MARMTITNAKQRIAELEAENARLKANRNNMTITLWSNADRDAERNQPHVTGTAIIDDAEYRLSLWKADPSRFKDNPPLLKGTVQLIES